ncbi:MAG: CBS domain-containing protein [Nitrospirales bacterium]
MTVGSIMSGKVVTVGMDDSLETVRVLFEQVRFHHLLVVGEKRRLLGVISDRDLLKAVSPFVDTLSETTRDRATLEKRVHQIMSRKPITVSRETSIADAAALLLEEGVSCLPVTSPEGEVEGIVTWKDLLSAFFKI